MPMETHSGTEAARESHLSCTASHMATGGGCCAASPVVVSANSDVLDESVYEGSEAPPPSPLWADVPADILGTVLRLLPCLADRASVPSVCRHWRAAARVQALPAPLPVLVLPKFIRFACLTSDGALTAARRALMPVEAAGDDVRIVGSCDEWLMAVRSSRHAKETSGECFLVNPFSSEVVHLPRLQSNSNYSYSCLDVSSSAHPVEEFFKACLLRSALSASPSSVSKYTVAAFTYRGCGPDPGLALWQPGMTSWYLCLSARIYSLSGDLAFYQGKLYMGLMYAPYILAFELREDEHEVSLSCPKKIYPLIPSKTTGSTRCNLVVWRGKLLLIIRFFSGPFLYNMGRNLRNVEVFALDFSTSPCGVTQIHNFHGDCIFVQKSGCMSFSAGLHLGVPVLGDLIYFFDDEGIINHVSYTYVHNMRDGTLRRIAAGLPIPSSGVLEESYLDFPVWIFPS